MASLARTASDTVAATSSSRFIATQESPTNFSAYERALAATSLAAESTPGPIGRPRRSTLFTNGGVWFEVFGIRPSSFAFPKAGSLHVRKSGLLDLGCGPCL
jgi:hypothetical protein